MWTFKLQSSLCQLLSFQRLHLQLNYVALRAAESPGLVQRPRAARSTLTWSGRADESRAWMKTGCGLPRIVPKPESICLGTGLLGEVLPLSPGVPSPGCRQRELLPLIGRQSLALLLDFRFRQPLSALWLWILFPPKNPISHLPRGKKNLAKQ